MRIESKVALWKTRAYSWFLNPCSLLNSECSKIWWDFSWNWGISAKNISSYLIVWVLQKDPNPTRDVLAESTLKQMVCFSEKPLEKSRTVNSEWYTIYWLSEVFQDLRKTSRQRQLTKWFFISTHQIRRSIFFNIWRRKRRVQNPCFASSWSEESGSYGQRYSTDVNE